MQLAELQGFYTSCQKQTAVSFIVLTRQHFSSADRPVRPLEHRGLAYWSRVWYAVLVLGTNRLSGDPLAPTARISRCSSPGNNLPELRFSSSCGIHTRRGQCVVQYGDRDVCSHATLVCLFCRISTTGRWHGITQTIAGPSGCGKARRVSVILPPSLLASLVGVATARQSTLTLRLLTKWGRCVFSV